MIPWLRTVRSANEHEEGPTLQPLSPPHGRAGRAARGRRVRDGAGRSPDHMAVGDLDGDGRSDVVITGNKTLDVLLNQCQ